MTVPPARTAAPPADPLHAERSDRRRLVGIDLARAIALLGMFAVHFVGVADNATPSPAGPGTGNSGPVPWSLSGLAEGRSMPLFVVLSGVGLSLLLRSRSGRPAAILGRAVVLLLLGLLLTGWTIVDVILQFYAVYIVVGLLAHRLRDRALLGLAGALTLGGLVYQVWRMLHPSTAPADFIAPGSPMLAGLESIADPVALLRELLFTGTYPLLPDGALFVVGMWVGRRNLTDARAARRFVVGGLLLVGGAFVLAATVGRPGGLTPADLQTATAGQTALAFVGNAAAHSHAPAWLLASLGWALVVLGLCLGVARRGRWLRPFAQLGSMTLTGYVAHILFLRWGGETWWTAHPTATAVGFFVALLAFASLWTPVFGRGPVEAMLRLSGTLAARAADEVRRRRSPAEPIPFIEGSPALQQNR